jgi:phage protein U
MTRPVPMVDDLALDAVAWLAHRTAPRTASIPVVGLAGDLQQQLGRSSHEIELAGVVVGEGARDRLAGIQQKAAAGTEMPFHADVATALDIQQVVVVAAEVVETAGRPDRYEYRLLLRESPPLPPPAELDPFGDLGGLGELGFDADALDDVLGEVTGLAEQAQGALDAANDAISQLESLAAISDLALGNPVGPLQREAGELAAVGQAAEAAAVLGRLLRGDG